MNAKSQWIYYFLLFRLCLGLAIDSFGPQNVSEPALAEHDMTESKAAQQDDRNHFILWIGPDYTVYVNNPRVQNTRPADHHMSVETADTIGETMEQRLINHPTEHGPINTRRTEGDTTFHVAMNFPDAHPRGGWVPRRLYQAVVNFLNWRETYYRRDERLAGDIRAIHRDGRNIFLGELVARCVPRN